MIDTLPNKDRKYANKFIDNRDFISLHELIEANIEKAEEKDDFESVPDLCMFSAVVKDYINQIYND